MEPGRHTVIGESTGNSDQAPGKHRANEMSSGIGLFPLGDRNRDRLEFGSPVLEERVSVDKYSKYCTN